MRGSKTKKHEPSRRKFLQQMGWAPVLLLQSAIQVPAIRRGLPGLSSLRTPRLRFADVFTPHYSAKSPLDDLFRLVLPGSDEYITEGYAAQIMAELAAWSQELRVNPRATGALLRIIQPSIESIWLDSGHEVPVRSGTGIDVVRRLSTASPVTGRDKFLGEFKRYLGPLTRLEIADFEIFSCVPAIASPLTLNVAMRYEFVGVRDDGSREARNGTWRTIWTQDESAGWRTAKWTFEDEMVSRSSERLFVDVTSCALGGNDSFKNQLAHGSDYWRTVLDGAIGVDVYGNNGIAVGDFDNNGRDDLYVCQPGGLPNRLYRNRGDGTLEDVTEKAGVDVLDFSSCALFADFENRGLEDLLVVCATGPLLFVNQGNGTFSLKKDAFHFVQPPQGSFTHAAIADYDHDGRLDVYFCLYAYYQGLDQYRYPVPYFDARNGPPNFLFHNSGGWTFEDRTESSGLNVDNDRYSFSCLWGDSNGDGWPDLYVVNDFGRNVLYRNKGNGTFAAVSRDAHVDEAGAGMSACWLDFDNDGMQDIYAAGMWVAAGMRAFEDSHFHPGEQDNIRTLYRRHMAGNSLYQNQGDGSFRNVGTQAGVEMGRWSWSADAWDFDHDGYPDLYVADGYISGLEKYDVSSFFWRQVVAKSPQDSSPSSEYERGWAAMNELIRADSTWNGRERNVLFANNRDGTFSDISGLTGLDFRDDSRAFALSDLDGDGRLEIILKNRTAPQIRILRNSMTRIGNSIAFRLRGEKSNRDAIGAAVTVTCGSLQQTKYLQAGTGFLSQHSKELFFGLGEKTNSVAALIKWPGGLTQNFENLPANSRIEIHEGVQTFQSKPFAASSLWADAGDLPTGEVLPTSSGTWLIEPVRAPEFSLRDQNRNLRELRSFAGKFRLLSLWTTSSAASRDQLIRLRDSYAALHKEGLEVLALNFDDRQDGAIRSDLGGENLPFPALLADAETAGVYNLTYRYLFDRHRDLSFPTCLLIDESGDIIKIYQGVVDPENILEDVASRPRTPAEHKRRALPFPGTLHREEFQRNAFAYGVAFFQHGYMDQAERAFQQAVAAKPKDADGYYNLGTVYLRRNEPGPAKQNLELALSLRPNYPEAWNNLGMLAAEQNNDAEAIRNFQRSLELRPSYSTALLNLGNVYRRKGDLTQAELLLKRAHEDEPNNPEVNYSLGMVYARGNESELAEQYLKNAIRLRPGYSDALNNLGVLLVQRQRYADAEADFKACIEAVPSFDQAYLNLARLYVVMEDKGKARSVLETLLQKQPQNQMAQQMIQLLY